MSEGEEKHYLEWHDVGGVLVAHFTTSFLRDERVIIKVFGELEDLAASGRKKVLINFTGLEAFASYAIGKLIKLNERLRADGRLALCALTPIVAEIIDIMNLRRTFHIYPDERSALESFV